MREFDFDTFDELCEQGLSEQVTVIDHDGTVLARMTPDVAERHAKGFIPATGNRLLHPALAEAKREADKINRNARITEMCEDMGTPSFWESLKS